MNVPVAASVYVIFEFVPPFESSSEATSVPDGLFSLRKASNAVELFVIVTDCPDVPENVNVS